MHTKPYEKKIPVKLTPEETEQRRTKQAIETPLALELHGHDPEDIDGALDRELPRICAKAHTEEFVLKALAKGVPASTPLSRKAAVERAVAAKHLGEVGGKLLWAPQEPKDDGIVDNDYRPTATH